MGPIEGEFEGVDLGDVRLDRRLLVMARALDEEPERSLAGASKTVASREAAYRFVENHRVSLDAILAPHRLATAQRCRDEGTVLVVSDTTVCSFSGEKRGEKLGRIQGKKRGFLAHVALAVSSDGERRPLGVVDVATIVRDDKKKSRSSQKRKADKKRESLRWGQTVERAEKLLAGASAIHVMDSEGDIYELFSQLKGDQYRFVIRCGQNRLVDDGKLSDAAALAPTLLKREVDLSARPKAQKSAKGRGRPARTTREASLLIAAQRVSIKRPRTCDCTLPEFLELNIVRVFEPEPPEGETPVEWLLATTEPIESADDVAAIVDAYRARWTIEEFFKALKTGCAFEARQLRSLRTLCNALGILAVVAWRLLLLRVLERQKSAAPATDAIEPIMIEALAARLRHIGEPTPLPEKPTVADVMNGIARLGGHHKSNGPPGWRLLWWGFHDLLVWTAGFIAGRSATSYDHS